MPPQPKSWASLLRGSSEPDGLLSQKISHTDQGRSKCVYIYIRMYGCVLVIRETSNNGHLHRLGLGKWPFVYWHRTYCVHLDQEISLTDTNYDHYTSIDETWMRLRTLYM